jgi:hypothetical protein
MKNLILLILMSFGINTTFSQVILNPPITKQDEYSIKLDKIEITEYNTILYFTHTSAQEYTNGGWVRIEPNITIKETYGLRKYKLIKAEGIPLSPNKFEYSYKGQTLSFRLIFPKIAYDINTIDLIECPSSPNCFNFYGIQIKGNNSSTSITPLERAGRKFIREKIQEWGECKNVAITLTGGDVAVYKTNGWAAQGAPEAMTDKLSELNATDNLIDDLVLTENGSWLILWGNNGVSSFNIPTDLHQKLKKWNDENEIITSITFNDNGDWIAITKNKYSASSVKVMDAIKEGESKHGEFWAAHITNDGMVLCYERGYKFFGNVPENLKKRLNETKINVFRIKFLSDGSFFIADFNGNYSYNM